MDEFIHVHCPKCGKGIRAPRAAGGRWGKCPSCHNKMYVPMPDDELEEIPLAPSEDDDAGMAEARRVEAELLRQRQLDDAGDSAKRRGGPVSSGSPSPKPAGEQITAAQISEWIIDYLVAMKSSDLTAAEQLVKRLAPVKPHAKSRIQQLMVDTMPPPRLGEIPSGLFLGFLKKLDQELG